MSDNRDATLRHCYWCEAMIQEQADLRSTELMEVLDFCLVDQYEVVLEVVHDWFSTIWIASIYHCRVYIS